MGFLDSWVSSHCWETTEKLGMECEVSSGHEEAGRGWLGLEAPKLLDIQALLVLKELGTELEACGLRMMRVLSSLVKVLLA